MAWRRTALIFAAIAASAAGPAAAACDAPDWDTATILARLAAAAPLTEGKARDRDMAAGLAISLAPMAEVTFTVPPERAPRNPDPLGAVLAFEAGAAGTYRVALSARAWIDVVQDGAYLAPVAFTDIKDCPDLHKIVAFEVGPGPFILQLSDATAPSVTLALTRAP